jgi:hypothetical protein
MKKLIKGFQQFVNESLTDDETRELFQMGFGTTAEPKIETGQDVSFPNWLYLSDDQYNELGLDMSNEAERLYDEIQTEMLAPVDSLTITAENYPYVHITVDLIDRTYTIHGVYDADPGTYSVTINHMIDNAGIVYLPMTLPLPDKFIQLLDEIGEDQ